MTSAFTEPPDLSTITIHRSTGTFVVRPAPLREPPFDDELDTASRVTYYDQPLPFERPRPRHLVAAEPAPSATPLRSGLPDPVQWSRRLLVGIIEVAAGRRPLNQLTALLAPSVAQGLRADFDRSAALGRPHWAHTAAVRSVRGSEPAEHVAEVCATVRAGQRVRAIAMRIEVRHGRWCCTRLVLG